jgi:putative ABC transport system permease protein
MWKATIRGLLARRLRLALTALAVLLGVSFVSATYVLTDTVKQSFDDVFRQTVAGIDLQVQAVNTVGGNSDPGRIPETVADTVAAVPGVARAIPFVKGYAQFVDRDGQPIGGGGPPTLGFSWAHGGPLRLVGQGSRAPAGAREVLMDAGTARENGYHVGDHVRVLLKGPAEQFRIVGLFEVGNRKDLGVVTGAAFDLETAQQAFDAKGSLDAVYVQAAPGTNLDALRARIEQKVGGGYEVLTAEEAAIQTGRTVRQALGFITYALLGFAAIGVVVGAFIIFNTFTILVTQRTRELGLLRAMGATGGQVVRSVVLEAFVVGVVASALGLAFGVVLAAGLLELLRAVGPGLPDTTTVLEARTIVVSLVVGVVVTVLASVLPAIRAARVPPISAINDVPQRAVQRGFGRRIVGGSVVLAGGVVALVWGLDRADQVNGIDKQVEVVALAAFAVLVGVVLLLPAVARPVVRVIGAPLRRLGPPGTLARANAIRNPRRTAVTASALVIGLALVGLAATFGASARASVAHDTATGLRADYVVKADGFAGFSNEAEARVAKVDGIAATMPLRFADVLVNGDIYTVGNADPAVFGQVVDLGLREGDVANLDDGGVLVAADTARRLGLHVGDTVPISFSHSPYTPLVVRGIYDHKNFIGLFGQSVPFLVTNATMNMGSGGDQQDSLVLVKADDGRAGEVGAALRRSLDTEFPNLSVLTLQEFRDDQQAQVNQFLAVIVAILVLSEIIAILGIINTLALSVFERTRELGLLRVVGMSRVQVRRMVRWESVMIALLGGVIGLALGVLWGWAFSRSLRGQGITVFSLPVWELVIFVLGSMLAGVLAAVGPAWRASRLDVLDALATE